MLIVETKCMIKRKGWADEIHKVGKLILVLSVPTQRAVRVFQSALLIRKIGRVILTWAFTHTQIYTPFGIGVPTLVGTEKE